MSKAFTKESDGADDDDLQLPALPAGGKNYITPKALPHCATSCST